MHPKGVVPCTFGYAQRTLLLDMPNALYFWICPTHSTHSTFGYAQRTLLEHRMDSDSSETYARGNTGAPSRAHSMRVKE
ncbi:hypothetical protein TNCV_3084941 [Trichonephila clavipes]|nr:hypothetical protein TNCV_3084941 [Trichonephila clavipes]